MFAISKELFWAFTAGEIALAALCISRLWRLAALFVAYGAYLGCLLVSLRISQRPCGCLGNLWIMTPTQQIQLLAVFGALGALALLLAESEDVRKIEVSR